MSNKDIKIIKKMELKRIKIKSIELTDNIESVFDLTVHKNSNFFVGRNKVLTHNCDYMTPNAQAALRNIIETFSKNTRFICTANYAERLIQPLRSRLVEFHVQPPDRKSVALRCKTILDSENAKYDPKDLISIVTQCYPDLRKTIQTLQRNSITGELKIDSQERIVSDYCDMILDELKNIGDVKLTFNAIRQIIADSKVRQFDDLFRYLFDKLEEFVPDGKRAGIILHIAEFQSKSGLVLDKEIQIAAMFINILRDLKS